ncbi:hypothetical protein GGS20DRAFT_553630 [Poronia punctata]|nr:hypothetical protein GGS20DRAFT_553630 [Poronia punctata]
MAPMGPSNKNGSLPGRNPKGTQKPQTEKASTRNGISKRRGAPRVDRDGDLNMDSPASKAGSHQGRPANAPLGPSRAQSRNPRPTTKTQQILQRALNSDQSAIASQVTSRTRGARRSEPAPLVTLQVEGLKSSKAAHNEGGGLRDLLTFLERKAVGVSGNRRTIRIKKSQIRGDFVYITASKEDADEILKVNGFLFAGVNLQITLAQDTPNGQQLSSSAQEVKAKLQRVLEQRYNGNTKLLDLSTLGADPTLNEMGFFSGESTPEKMFRALMVVADGLFKTAADKRNAVASISLAGNNINDVSQIISLTDTFPDVVHLELSRNQFKDIRGLQKWRHRLRSLETILLNENPIEVECPTYKSELVSWFPKLSNLSGTQVRTPEQVAAASTIRLIQQSGADFRDLNGVGEAFVREFVPMYDADRYNLAAKYYDEQSTFSVAVNTRPSHRGNGPTPSWGSYIKFSRNHVKITHAPSRQQRIFKGVGQIQALWQQLPRTQHPDLNTHPQLYIVDCHAIHGLEDPSRQSLVGVDGMIITINGVFEDQENGSTTISRRSFSRTITLGPGAPGRNPIRVVSDLLFLKSYSPLPAPTATMVPVPSNPPPKEQMILELCKQTGMTVHYTQLCLEGANWDFNRALASFHQNKANLPPDAFVTV